MKKENQVRDWKKGAVCVCVRVILLNKVRNWAFHCRNVYFCCRHCYPQQIDGIHTKHKYIHLGNPLRPQVKEWRFRNVGCQTIRLLSIHSTFKVYIFDQAGSQIHWFISFYFCPCWNGTPLLNGRMCVKTCWNAEFQECLCFLCALKAFLYTREWKYKKRLNVVTITNSLIEWLNCCEWLANGVQFVKWLRPRCANSLPFQSSFEV